MENSRKYLRLYSIFILIFAAYTLITLAVEVLFAAFDNVEIPEGAPENVGLIAQIVILSISFILLLPQLYVGLKGLKMAKYPNSSRGHIIWAMILLVFAVLGSISPIKNLISGTNARENFGTVTTCLVEISIYFEYIRYAKAVAEDN